MNTYTGTLVTYSRTSQSTQQDVAVIQGKIQEIAFTAGLSPNVFAIQANRDLLISLENSTSMFANPFLPVEERTDASWVSFDTVVSYVVYSLAKEGYHYNGTVEASNAKAVWKLRVDNGDVFRAEGQWKIVYNEDAEYQVGGIEL